MARTDPRSGPSTRSRIAEAAARLFLDRGFDRVTVADVAREAGVSSVTVFKHFPRKEDLFLDRQQEAADLIRSAVRERGDADVVPALRGLLERLADERHPLSGLDPRSVPFFRTVAASSALVARARAIAADLARDLEEELAADSRFHGDARLLAVLFVAGAAAALTGVAGDAVAGRPVALPRGRLDALLSALAAVEEASAAG